MSAPMARDDGTEEPAEAEVAGGYEEVVLQHAAQHQPQDERRPGPAETLHEPPEQAERKQQDQVAEVTLGLEGGQEHHHDHQRRQQVTRTLASRARWLVSSRHRPVPKILAMAMLQTMV